MIPSLGKYLGDHLFLANVALGDVLDRNPSLASNRRRLLTHPITQRRRKLRIVENADPLRIKKVGHAPCKARPWKRSSNQNTIVAGQHTCDMLTIAFRQRPRHLCPRPPIPSRYDNPVWFRLRQLRVGKLACSNCDACVTVLRDFTYAIDPDGWTAWAKSREASA